MAVVRSLEVKKLSDKDELYENLKAELEPLLEFLSTLENVHEAEVCGIYSILCISRQYPISVSLGLLERAKHSLLNPKKHIEDTLSFVV